MTMMWRYDRYVNIIGEERVADFLCSVYEQSSQQVSITFNHINRVKLFTENSAMARLQDILRVRGNLTGLGQSDPKSFQAKLTVEFLSVVSECYSKLLLAWTRLTIKKGLCTCHLGHLCNWIINNKTLRQLALLNKQQKNKKKVMCCNKSKPTISLYKNWTTDWLGSIILIKFFGNNISFKIFFAIKTLLMAPLTNL